MASTTHVGRRILRLLCVQALWAVLVPVQALERPGSRPDRNQHAGQVPGISWIEVEGGNLTMGTGTTARQYSVNRFLISATEITFDQYDAFCAATGKPRPDDNGWGRGTRPVLKVSYEDAVGFCRWLSDLTGKAVRLPSELEWEYAAGGGRHTRGYIHSGSNNKDEVSWNEDNSGGKTHPVGTKKPNELGIFDMSGNLWEWCADWTTSDGRGGQFTREVPGDETKGTVRGNSFDNPGSRSGYRQAVRVDRDSRHINIGFRIARSY